MSLTGKIMTFFSDKAKTQPVFPRTKIKAVSDDDGVGLNVILERPVTAERLAAGATYTSVVVTLTAAGWSSNAQTVSVAGVTADNAVIVCAAPASLTAYGEAGVYCSAQAAEELTFTCTETPSADLTVNILMPR